MTDFASLGLDATLCRAVAAEGYTTPTPIQTGTIPTLLAGRDVLGIAQTGTGKTAAFALPILQRLAARPDGQRPRPLPRGVRALILSPTRELAVQIGDSFATYGRGLGLSRVVVTGGVSMHSQIGALSRGADILVATPGRLLDLANQRKVRLDGVETFVLDEADRMLDMGFIRDVRKIVALLPRVRQTLLFSATMPDSVAQLAAGILHTPQRIEVTPVASTVERIEQKVLFVARDDKSRLLEKILRGESVSRAIVFTRTKHGANRVAEQLQKRGLSADAIHGNKSQGARQRALSRFRDGHVQALVATDIAARGIDVDGISHVINFDLPVEPESYVHRIGRTARAGADGIALSLCGADELDQLRAIEKLIGRKVDIDDGHPFHAAAVAGSHVARGQGRPHGYRAEGYRPQGGRPHGDRPHGDRSQGDRPHGGRPQGGRPQGGRPGGQRSGGQRSGGHRSGGGQPPRFR